MSRKPKNPLSLDNVTILVHALYRISGVNNCDNYDKKKKKPYCADDPKRVGLCRSCLAREALIKSGAAERGLMKKSNVAEEIEKAIKKAAVKKR